MNVTLKNCFAENRNVKHDFSENRKRIDLFVGLVAKHPVYRPILLPEAKNVKSYASVYNYTTLYDYTINKIVKTPCLLNASFSYVREVIAIQINKIKTRYRKKTR